METQNTAVQVKIFWGENPIYVTELCPPRSFTVGEDGCDFTVPREVLGVDRLDLVEVREGGLTLLGEDVTGERHTARAERGAVRFEVVLGAPEQKVARAFGTGEAEGTIAYFGASLFSVGGLLAAMAFLVPPSGLTTGEAVNADQLVAMQAYLEASAERERERQPSEQGGEAASDGGKSGAPAEGPAGQMGKPETAPANKRFAKAGSEKESLPRLSRLEEARNFGIIGLLAAGADTAALDVFARDASLGSDPFDVEGNLWGDDIGESGGHNGLSLHDFGDGGGGERIGIGLGTVRTLDGGNGSCKPGEACGFDGGPSRGTHRVKAPVLRVATGIDINGRLPAEVVQRLVRQNFGRFRGCYERGLARNPNLEGRVAVRFLIARDGSVSSASNGGSSLPDAEVTSCVVGQFYGLSFPKPENGTVTVTYPILFSPG